MISVLPINENNFRQALDKARTTAGTKSIAGTILLGNGTEVSAVSNADNDRFPVSADMHFSIASCTKTFIAGCIFKLIEEKRLTMDDTLQALLYDAGILAGSDKTKFDPQIKICNLLNHTSGIEDFLNFRYYYQVVRDMRANWTPHKTLSYISSKNHPYNHIDSDQNSFYYTDANYVLLGMIIEHVAGNKIEAVVSDYFLKPLNLQNTYMAGVLPYLKLSSIPEPNATGFIFVFIRWIPARSLFGKDLTALYSSLWTSSNMVSTPAEMARWIKYYYQYQIRNGYILDKAFHLSTEATKESIYFKEIKFGYGLEYLKHRSGSELWGHTGTIMGFRSLAFCMPEKDLSIAIMINDGFAARWDIMNIVIEYINSRV
jgi:D-alanyl-D-alanine carboxypeptidase